MTSWHDPDSADNMLCIGPHAGSQQGFSCALANRGKMNLKDLPPLDWVLTGNLDYSMLSQLF